MSRYGLCLVFVASLATATGCAETTRIKTYPPGAAVTVNGRPVGTSPVVYQVPRSQFPDDGVFHYHVEREGYRPAEGEFRSISAGGRIAGGIFTLGILFLFRGATTLPDGVDVVLEPVGAPVAAQASSDAAVRLRRLENLLEQGVIQDDEYRRERGKILHGL